MWRAIPFAMRDTLRGPHTAGADDAEHRDVDLLIRSGGEKRLSDFLLWECAYAELFFSDRMWPDFGAEDLGAAVNDFRKRERRFGGVVVTRKHSRLDASALITAGFAE